MNEYPHNEKIKQTLAGYADHVQKDGLNYLIPGWQRFADNYADSESSIDEWLNDLDGRRVIDEILLILSEDEKSTIERVLKPIDQKVRDRTFEVNECVWGTEGDKHYNRIKNWYYYRVNQNILDNEPGRFTKK